MENPSKDLFACFSSHTLQRSAGNRTCRRNNVSSTVVTQKRWEIMRVTWCHVLSLTHKQAKSITAGGMILWETGVMCHQQDLDPPPPMDLGACHHHKTDDQKIGNKSDSCILTTHATNKRHNNNQLSPSAPSVT